MKYNDYEPVSLEEREERIAKQYEKIDKIHRVNKILFWLGVILLALVYFAADAKAHTAPTGWSYDIQCCNTMDCRQVRGPHEEKNATNSPVQILEVTGGYKISTTGEFIKWNDPKVRESKDEFYHWCSAGGLDGTKSLCIYVPNRGI